MESLNASGAQVEQFIRYLAENEIIEETASRRAYEKKNRVDLRLGRIALLEGFILPEEINKILWVQRELTEKKFGEVAVDLGLMTPAEVRQALELQNDELFAFCQSVILEGLVAPQTLFAVLKGFLESGIEGKIERKRAELQGRVTRSIRDALKKITVVAPMPGAIARLMQMLNDPEVRLDEVAKIIGMDVGLTAMLLRLSNSAFYGLKSQVTNVSRAVTVLGTKKLRQLILSAAVMDNFKALPPDRLAGFWEISMRIAQWSKELSQVAGKPETDEFFLAGFLHNIGELVLRQHFPGEYRQIEERIQAGTPRLQSEVAVMGCDHADVGSYLLSLWQLSAPVVQASMLHHHPRLHLQQMSGITAEAKVVNMSVAIVESDFAVNAFGHGLHLGQVVEDYKSIVAIDYRKVKEMKDRVEGTVAELMKWFSV